MIQVHYSDKKGAGCMRAFATEDEAGNFMRRLRRPATAVLNGILIGEVWLLEEQQQADIGDKRLRWGYTIDINLADTENVAQEVASGRQSEASSEHGCIHCGLIGAHHCERTCDETDCRRCEEGRQE